MSVFDETKIDAHCHVIDPARFAYAPDVNYRPAGQEVGTLAQYRQVMDAYGVRHALLVGPNSGYGLDNRCLLDAIAAGAGRFKGIAVVRNDASLQELQRLKAAGVVGVALNATVHGVAHYVLSPDLPILLNRLADLDLFVQIQVEADQLLGFMPLLQSAGTRILIDHCGRPVPGAGLAQPGFQALLALARTGRAAVKLSGLQKFSAAPPPYDDTLPCWRALVDAYTLDACLWATDWPFLKAAQRLDVGPLIRRVEQLLPDAADRRRLWWDTPCRLFGFACESN